MSMSKIEYSITRKATETFDELGIKLITYQFTLGTKEHLQGFVATYGFEQSTNFSEGEPFMYIDENGFTPQLKWGLWAECKHAINYKLNESVSAWKRWNKPQTIYIEQNFGDVSGKVIGVVL